jgi:lysozyme
VDIYDQLRRDEGVRLRPYIDTVGKVTIGVGRNISDVGISADEAEILLQNDVSRAMASLQRLPFYSTLDPIRQAAIVNMVFNLGIDGFLAFGKTIQYLQTSEWEQAAKEMLDSEWAKQVGPRAYRISQQIRTGQWT